MNTQQKVDLIIKRAREHAGIVGVRTDATEHAQVVLMDWPLQEGHEVTLEMTVSHALATVTAELSLCQGGFFTFTNGTTGDELREDIRENVAMRKLPSALADNVIAFLDSLVP